MLISYASKCAFIAPSYQDASVLAILAVLSGSKHYFAEYFRLKEQVISENVFRNAVNGDIAEIKTKLSQMSLASKGNPFGRQK